MVIVLHNYTQLLKTEANMGNARGDIICDRPIQGAPKKVLWHNETSFAARVENSRCRELAHCSRSIV